MAARRAPATSFPSTGPGSSRYWGGGIVGAALLVGYGVYCLVAGRAHIPGYRDGMSVGGALATALGIAYIGLGVFLHCHLVWEEHTKLWRFSLLGKLPGILAFAGGLGYVLYQIIAKL